MSLLDYPRINFKGLLQVNVGTANNDDYSSDYFADGPYQGQPVRLGDSVNVQPMTYGMSDEDWLQWVVTPGVFTKNAQSLRARSLKTEMTDNDNVTLIPAEWNYYGDMGLTMMNVNNIGIVDPKNQIPLQLKTQIQSSVLSFNNRPSQEAGRSTGMLIDVNPEDPSNSQVFSDFLSLESGGQFLFSGKPSKAVTRWINFQRNVNLGGPNGAAATFQCTVPLSELQGQPILQGMPTVSGRGEKLAGIVCRFTMFRSLQNINTYKYQGQSWFDQITELYNRKGINPTFVQISVTVAPWFEGEMESMTAGRYLLPASNTIPIPPGSKGNGKSFRLAPAMFMVNTVDNVISIDFSATFPDNYQGQYDPMQTDDNPKYDFGQLSLGLIYNGEQFNFADILYAPTIPNDGMGWIFDIPFDPTIPGLLEKLQQGDLVVSSPQFGNLLQETTYLIVSDQSCVYAEQNINQLTTDQFRSDGAGTTNIFFQIYKKGIHLSPDATDTFVLWSYDTTPNQSPGNATLLNEFYKSGQPISLPVDSPGNRLITAVPADATPPPVSYGNFDMMTQPLINIRILPNNVDYSMYYVDPSDPQPVGNDLLTFEVIYNEVLRNYYLLYPAMSQRIPLNDPAYWNDSEMAGRLMQRISLDFWGTAEAMPRTRDLSQSRRILLNAWCLKFFQTSQTTVSADTKLSKSSI